MDMNGLFGLWIHQHRASHLLFFLAGAVLSNVRSQEQDVELEPEALDLEKVIGWVSDFIGGT